MTAADVSRIAARHEPLVRSRSQIQDRDLSRLGPLTCDGKENAAAVRQRVREPVVSLALVAVRPRQGLRRSARLRDAQQSDSRIAVGEVNGPVRSPCRASRGRTDDWAQHSRCSARHWGLPEPCASGESEPLAVGGKERGVAHVRVRERPRVEPVEWLRDQLPTCGSASAIHDQPAIRRNRDIAIHAVESQRW